MNVHDIQLALRAVVPATWVDGCRFHWHRLKFKQRNRAFQQAHPNIQFPPDYFMYETYRLDYRDYWEDGRATANELVELFKQYGLSEGPVTLLDWGCGPGRVLRHLTDFLPTGSVAIGADYNPTYVAWCQENLPHIIALEHGIDPPLPLQAASCDGVFGLSILTHLHAEKQQQWLRELYRITKPGGLAILTTHGVRFRHKLSRSEQAIFDRGELVVREQGREGHRVFASFQPKTWMETELLKAGWKLAGWISGGSTHSIHGDQDTWVLSRSNEPA